MSIIRMRDNSSALFNYEVPTLCPEYAPPSTPPWTYHLSQTLLFTLFYFVVDVLAKRQLSDSNTRWFFLHALANLITAVASVRDLLSVFFTPMCSMVSPILSWIPTHAGMAIHLYHCIGFFSFLRTDDIVHHVVFGGGMGALNFILPWGRVTNALLFFITGAPGGCTYAMLVLVKLGKMQSLTEKSISAFLNTWVRAPGLLWFTTCVLVNFMHGTLHVPSWAAMMCVLLSFTNGTYYGAQALENFVTRKTELIVKERLASAAKAPAEVT